jgi:hypothetical protein
MAAPVCTWCGAVLRDGLCPNGHPQRASRQRRRRPRRRWPVVLPLVFLLIATALYAGLTWYPARAAEGLMRPTSGEFARSVDAFRTSVEAIPEEADPEELLEGAAATRPIFEDARTTLAEAQIALEDRTTGNVPVLSSRAPLRQALDLRERVLAFYTSGLEIVSDLESVAGYLTELQTVLPQLGNIRRALEDAGGGNLGGAVASASPVANQMLSDLRALIPPDELGAAHASLVSIARRIRANLEEISGADGPGARPVVNALLGDIQNEIASFQATVGQAGELARRGGLGTRVEHLDREVEAIAGTLAELRSLYDVEGIQIPEEAEIDIVP